MCIGHQTGVWCTPLRMGSGRHSLRLARQIREELFPGLAAQSQGVRLKATSFPPRRGGDHRDMESRRGPVNVVLDIDDMRGIEPQRGVDLPELRHLFAPFLFDTVSRPSWATKGDTLSAMSLKSHLAGPSVFLRAFLLFS